MACKHADLALIYAKQMTEIDEPWKLWRKKWINGQKWKQCLEPIAFGDEWEFELIPKTILINGIDVPEPMREKPTFGAIYYFIYASERFYDRQSWTDDERDNFRLKTGLCHSTKESAITHAKALFSFTEVK